MFDYIKEVYGIDVNLGMDVLFNGQRGIVSEDRGHYVGVTFDCDKAGVISSIHPTDELLVFTGKNRKIRRMSRSQQNYQNYLRADCGETFAEWMGFA